MRYFIYRLTYDHYLKMNKNDIIRNDIETVKLEEGDMLIVIVSKSLLVIGSYRYNASKDNFLLQQKIGKEITEFYTKLPMVKFVNERTYKLFAKRIREIDKDNFDAFVKGSI